MVEFLLENRADVNAKDKGGLIPLHNASSFGVSVKINQYAGYPIFCTMMPSLSYMYNVHTEKGGG